VRLRNSGRNWAGECLLTASQGRHQVCSLSCWSCRARRDWRALARFAGHHTTVLRKSTVVLGIGEAAVIEHLQQHG